MALRKPSGRRRAEVAADVLVGVRALAMAEKHHAPAFDRAEPGEHRLVIAERAIAVQLDDVGEECLDVVLRLGPVGMTRDLHAVPWREVRVGLDAQRVDLGGERVDLGGELGVLGKVEPAQIGEFRLELDQRSLEVHDVAGLGHASRHRPSRPARGSRAAARCWLFSSPRGTTSSIMPCSSMNSAVWKPFGSFRRSVCSMTRAPVKPMSAPGSASSTSPRTAKLAVTPPYVGLVSTLMYGRPASEWRRAAALVFAICMSESMPSCMRAPPDAVTNTTGRLSAVANSKARVIFSPTTLPIEAPMKRKSIAPSTSGWSSSVALPGDDRLGQAATSRRRRRAGRRSASSPPTRAGRTARGRRRARRSCPRRREARCAARR